MTSPSLRRRFATLLPRLRRNFAAASPSRRQKVGCRHPQNPVYGVDMAVGSAAMLAPDLLPRLREGAATGKDADEIASLFGPDSQGLHYSPRSIYQIAWEAGIQLPGAAWSPIPTAAQLASELRDAGWTLQGGGRWISGSSVVVTLDPKARVTRQLSAKIRRAIRGG